MGSRSSFTAAEVAECGNLGEAHGSDISTISSFKLLVLERGTFVGDGSISLDESIAVRKEEGVVIPRMRGVQRLQRR